MHAHISNELFRFQRGLTMKFFDLKFTPENAKKHSDYSISDVVTTRDEPKGELGDITIFNDDVYILVFCIETTLYDLQNYNLPNRNCPFWEREGFNTREEYLTEIMKIYGKDLNSKLYVHGLKGYR